MGRNPDRSKATALLALLLPALALALTGCLDIAPKVLGAKGRFDFSAFDSGTQSSFKFNFALLTTTRATNTVYLQGSANTKSGLIGTCNLAGTNCVCEFLDSAGNTLQATNSTQISYDETGNYYRCTYTGSTASLSKVRIKNLANTVRSDDLTVSSTITLSQLIGNELDINRVRYIFRYACEYQFLQKEGTTTQGFDCSAATAQCDPNDGLLNPNFCFLKAKFPFYLFSDTYSTNFFQKISDKVYNGGGTDKICGLQIKQINCVGSDSNPADAFGASIKQFGLYGQLAGIWETSVQLPPGPDQSATSYGFAAKTSAVTGECPPGLVKRIFFTSTIITSDIVPSHNFASNQVSTEVADPIATPAAFQISQYGQGSCNGTACSLPVSVKTVDVHNGAQTYSSTGQTAFCVIPASMLP